MRWRLIINMSGVLTIALGITMILSIIIGIFYNDNTIMPFVRSMTITSICGLLAYFFCPVSNKSKHITQREGMAIVATGWTVICVFGSLPFYFDESFVSFIDAFFESVSGFTTTGSSVLTNIEAVSKSILFWRSFIQWLGGMGIIVLSLAILPFLGVGGMQLFKAEVPSPAPDKLKPRIRDTAKILWKVYLVITLVEVFLLLLGGMSFFDSICHAFTTMPTGGFSTKNISIAHYNQWYFDFVIIIFMIIAGINFTLHYQFLTGKPLTIFKDVELRFFILLIIIFTSLITFNVYESVFDKFSEAFRYSFFQVVSIITTTGYATYDYELWPPMSQVILFFCMFIGASAGSTGGGMKCIRILLCFKYCYKELFILIHPHAVSKVKINNKLVPSNVLHSILGFIVLYIFLFVISSIIMAGLGVDFITSITSVASSLGNIGPGFGIVGPAKNYASIPDTGKWVLIGCMLLGRLEIYTVIILLVPEFWRK